MASKQILVLGILFVCVTHGTISNWSEEPSRKISTAHRSQSSLTKIRIDGHNTILPYDNNDLNLNSTQTGKLYLTVAYCPTLVSSAGAVFEVDVSSGAVTKVGDFKWGSNVAGCPAYMVPTVATDTSKGNLYLYFIDGEELTEINLYSAKVVHYTTSTSLSFTGYQNMAWSTSDNTLEGLSGTLTLSGFCEFGCLQYGTFSSSGKYTSKANVPFKQVATEAHFLDTQTQTYYAQGLHDLRSPQQCGHGDNAACLLGINTKNGELKSSTYNNFTIYKFGNNLNKTSSQLLTWIKGYDNVCHHGNNDFLFAELNLATGIATPVACIPQDVELPFNQMIASFSLDETLFATGYGDEKNGAAQLVVFNTKTGEVVLDSNLAAVRESLASANGLFFVWSVDWVPSK